MQGIKKKEIKRPKHSRFQGAIYCGRKKEAEPEIGKAPSLKHLIVKGMIESYKRLVTAKKKAAQ